mgnify:FL=1
MPLPSQTVRSGDNLSRKRGRAYGKRCRASVVIVHCGVAVAPIFTLTDMTAEQQKAIAVQKARERAQEAAEKARAERRKLISAALERNGVVRTNAMK